MTAEAAGSGGNHLGRVTISRNRSDKILHKRPGGHGLGEPGIALGRGGDPQRQGDPAAEPLAFLKEVEVAKAAEEALQEVKMALEARVLTRPPILRAYSW